MKKALTTLSLTFPPLVGAQVSPPVNAPPAPVQPPEAPVEPPEVGPESTLPPPPESAPPLPPAQVIAPPAPTAPPQAERGSVPPVDGQWVYTAQFGWVWMPFGPQFVHVPTGGAPPQMFVFYPAFGWRWVVAPWVWGLGPQPFWGVHGSAQFGWWGRGFGRWYGLGLTTPGGTAGITGPAAAGSPRRVGTSRPASWPARHSASRRAAGTGAGDSPRPP